jgi:cytochrome P450
MKGTTPATYSYPSDEINQDPYPFYEWCREHDPVHAIGDGRYLITRYHDIMTILHDPSTYSNILTGYDLEEEVRCAAAEGMPIVPTIQANDPPGHDQYKRIVGRRFLPRAVAGYEPAIRALVSRLIDGFPGSGEVDFIEDLARPLPLQVVMMLLSLPDADYPRLRAWSDGYLKLISQLSSTAERVAGRRCLNEMQHYFEGQLAERRGADDLIGEVAGAVSRDEVPLVGAVDMLCRDLVIAGNETTVFLLANAMAMMLTDTSLGRSVREDPARIPRLLEESLRSESPSQHLRRVVTRDVVLHGTAIPAGATLLLMWGSANRDAEVFDDAERFDLDRGWPEPHLAFGRGIHFCLGAYIARLEGRVAFEELIRRSRSIELDTAKTDLSQAGYDNFRAPKALHLRYYRAR